MSFELSIKPDKTLTFKVDIDKLKEAAVAEGKVDLPRKSKESNENFVTKGEIQEDSRDREVKKEIAIEKDV